MKVKVEPRSGTIILDKDSRMTLKQKRILNDIYYESYWFMNISNIYRHPYHPNEDRTILDTRNLLITLSLVTNFQ